MADLAERFGQFVRGTQRLTEEGRTPYFKEWMGAIEKGEIPFEPVGLGVIRTVGRVKKLTPPDFVKEVQGWLRETWGKGRKGLPLFRKTEDAMTFGAMRAGDQRASDLLKAARKETDREWKELFKKAKEAETFEEKTHFLQRAQEVGQEGAFYQEARDTVRGRMPAHYLEDFGFKGYTGLERTPEDLLREETKGFFKGFKEEIPKIYKKAHFPIQLGD